MALTTNTELSLSPQARVLYLTADIDLIRRQLAGENLPHAPYPLLDNISTDEIIPAWACFWHDETLGRYALVGLREGAIAVDAIRNGGFEVLVCGRSKGCGSSRETAPYAEKAAGIRLVVAHSFEKIYRQNCYNIGLLTCTDLNVVPRLARGLQVPIAEITRDVDEITRDIISCGGLGAYNRARLCGQLTPSASRTAPRAMTLVEKIVARHVAAKPDGVATGAAAVAPKDAAFCSVDVRFSHDYTTAMAASLLRDGFGTKTHVNDPGSAYAFRDHLVYLHRVMPPERRQQGLLDAANAMADAQRCFCAEQGIRLYGDSEERGAEAICHNAILEDIALPGQLIVGTDSHTCTAGALGCFAFGVGASDMANAWVTHDIRLTVPHSARIELHGTLRDECTSKDLMLYLLSQPEVRDGAMIGMVLDFAGDGVAALAIDERATLTNMAVEAGAVSGIVAADDTTWSYLANHRPNLEIDRLRREVPRADDDACYAQHLHIDLAEVPIMVAKPGDPRNAVPIAELQRTPIHIAYGGSCTGGKCSDMDQYARVLAPAAARAERIAPGVQLYIQFGSQQIRRYAIDRGYCDVFTRVGAELLMPACGACIGAGPGISDTKEQVTVAALNRNFPGRSGPGDVYLASPLVVAASALAGHIVSPRDPLLAPTVSRI